jgi:tetratricopeptide (TPR) repeat protein/predicted Ser/Thr protein kinase
VTGRTLSHYEILDDLGAGGMGVVYRAHDARLDRDVAIKVLPTDRPLSENARKRFQREALAASALNHPNIITIYEVGSEGDTDFIVMEYVRGATLSSLLKKRPLGLAEATRYCVQVADALTKAHASGIIHRDLKPGNIMITEDGLVKVLDFGLAKFDPSAASKDGESADSDTAAQFTLTQPGMVTGTVAYMSPEQARGERVDARSDIFSFGVVMFETLSRHLPFTGPNSIAVLHNLHFSPPRDLEELAPKAPKPLVSLISRMLEKKPEKRIQTMSEVATELRKHAAGLVDGPVTWHPSDATVEMASLAAPGGKKICWRNVWLAGLAVLLVVGGGVFGWRHYRKPRPAQNAMSAAQTFVPGDTAYSLYQRARQNLDHWDREGNIDNAIQLGERALQLDPQSAASHAVLGDAYVLKNQANPDPQWIRMASQYANKAVSIDNYLSTAHISLGRVMMESGDTAGAEKELRTAADLDPKNDVPHALLGKLYNKLGKPQNAHLELERALQLNKNNWETYMQLGLNAYKTGAYKEAASSWEEALRLEPDNVQALRNLGAVYHLLGRDDDAASALQHSLEIHPTADAYNNLGYIRFYQGRYQDAVPAFEKTVALGANSFDNWASLADAYRWTPGNADKAKQAYDTAIRLVREEIAKNPNQADLRAYLALYLAENGDKASALKELKPVEQAHSKDPGVLYNVAVTYELAGDRDKALEALLVAVKAGQSLDDIKNDPELVSLRADPRYHLKIAGAAKPNP